MARIIIATRIYLPEPAAASFRLGALAESLSEKGDQVTVLTAKLPSSLEDDPPRKGEQVKRFPVWRDSTGYIKGYLQYLSFDVPLFFRLLAAGRADAIVCEPPPTTGVITRLASTVTRTPYTYYAADIWSDAAAASSPGFVVKALRVAERFAMKGASSVIAVSEGVASRLEAMGIDSVVVENGIDTSRFTLEGPVPGGTYFVYAGTASEWQGAEVFAEAMVHVVQEQPEAKLIYVGGGSIQDRVEHLAAVLPQDAIEIRGRVSPEDAANLQRGAVAALVSIQPGLGYDFAMPTKVYSALATGTPVIYAGPGPLREHIENQNLGRVVNHDSRDVAAAMLSALSDQERVTTNPDRRQSRRSWVETYHSLRETGRKAASIVQRTVRPRRGNQGPIV